MSIIGLAQYNITPLQMSTKLAEIINLVNLGMFAESIILVSALVRDGFLTEQRITRYISMLTSANAIVHD